MDGVLVDSEKFICKAACLMFEELGLKVIADDFTPFVGTGENRYIGGVAEKYNFPIEIDIVKKRTYDIYLEIIQGESDRLSRLINMVLDFSYNLPVYKYRSLLLLLTRT